MSHFDLHVTAVPDHKAQLVIARLIVGSNGTTNMQAALEMAANPPLLLLKGLTRKEAEQHATHLKSLSIGVMVAEIEDTVNHTDNAAATALPTPSPLQTDVTAVKTTATASDFGDFAGIRAHNAANQQSPLPMPTPLPMRTFVSSQSSPTAPCETHTPVNGDDRERTHEHVNHCPAGSATVKAHEENKRLEEAEEAENKRNKIITAIMAGILLLIGIVIFLSSREINFSVGKKSGARGTRTASASAMANIRSGVSLAPSDSSGGRSSAANGQQRMLADSYIDSARASGGNLDQRVAFYKMAISFNRYNYAAWHGLLQTYNDLQMRAEARETEAQMMDIFGSQVVSTSDIVNRSYGELSDAYMGDDGVYRVEYRSRKRKKGEIKRDIFNMVRAIRTACSCRTISVVATTADGKGMIVHTTPETSVHSFSEFSTNANITWLE